MEMLNEQICIQRQKTIDERCLREQKDLERVERKQEEEEERSEKIEDLNIKMGEILKNHEEKILSHDKRIGKLEEVSVERYNTIINYVLSGLIGAVVSTAMNVILGG